VPPLSYIRGAPVASGPRSATPPSRRQPSFNHSLTPFGPFFARPRATESLLCARPSFHFFSSLRAFLWSFEPPACAPFRASFSPVTTRPPPPSFSLFVPIPNTDFCFLPVVYGCLFPYFFSPFFRYRPYLRGFSLNKTTRKKWATPNTSRLFSRATPPGDPSPVFWPPRLFF